MGRGCACVVQVPEPVSARYRSRAGKCQAGAEPAWSSMNRDRTRDRTSQVTSFAHEIAPNARQPGRKPRLTCTFGVEVKGLEPSASTLRINNGHFRHLV